MCLASFVLLTHGSSGLWKDSRSCKADLLNLEDSIMNEFDFDILTAGEPAQFGKYGSLQLRYLKENKPTLYQALLQGHLLNAHLNEIDQQAHEVVEQIAQQLIRSEQFDESVKLSNPILWVQKMNSFKDIAEETVMRDLIYC